MTEQTEPSMEEILSSIRQILSTDEEKTDNETILSDPVSSEHLAADDVMELTSDMLVKDASEIASQHNDSDMELLSEETVQASADQLHDLTARLQEQTTTAKQTPLPHINSHSVEDLVCALLRPYLKEWLDANLPALVEKIVKKEVERLTNNIK